MLPPQIVDELNAYRDGKHPYEFGSFLTAILANDFVRAAGLADSINRYLLFEYAEFLYNHLPIHMWGSYEAVRDCIETQKRQSIR